MSRSTSESRSSSRAIEEGRPHRASGRLALHVLETTIDAVEPLPA